MMKTLCVAVVVLSLTSVCQPASLACEKLLKPPDSSTDFTGRWHYIAMSLDHCLVPIFLNVFRPVIEMNITSMDTPNVYNADFKFQSYGYCLNKSTQFFYESTMSDADSSNATVKPGVLLQSGCPDCIIMKKEDINNHLALFSKRKTVTDAELKEFETQAECLGWSKPLVFSSDHDNENCKSLEGLIHDADSKKIASMMLERMKSMHQSIIQCEHVLGFSFNKILTSYLEAAAGQ